MGGTTGGKTFQLKLSRPWVEGFRRPLPTVIRRAGRLSGWAWARAATGAALERMDTVSMRQLDLELLAQ